jgi:hypothetical protein
VKVAKAASTGIITTFIEQFPDAQLFPEGTVQQIPKDWYIFSSVRQPVTMVRAAYAEVDQHHITDLSKGTHTRMNTTFNRLPYTAEPERYRTFLQDVFAGRFHQNDEEHWWPHHAYPQTVTLCNVPHVNRLIHTDRASEDWLAVLSDLQIPPAQHETLRRAQEASKKPPPGTDVAKRVAASIPKDFTYPDAHFFKWWLRYGFDVDDQTTLDICDLYHADFVCFNYSFPEVCAKHAATNYVAQW